MSDNAGSGYIESGGSSRVGISARLSKYRRTNPTRGVTPELKEADCVRMVLFNTQRTSVAVAWEELRAILNPEMFASIVALKRVTYRNRNPRIDLWARGETAASLVRIIRQMSRRRTPGLVSCMRENGVLNSGLKMRETPLSNWRIALWRSYIDRQVDAQPQVQWSRERSYSFMSMNVNGFHSKKLQVEDVLRKEKVAVCALQETLVSDRNYPIRLGDYNTFAIPWQEGFRGQALLVDSALSAYEIPHEEFGNHLLHVKISGLDLVKRPVHVLAVYLPSGGNFRRARTEVMKCIVRLYTSILESDNGAPVVCLGDFNMPPERLEKLLKDEGDKVYRAVPVGSQMTRFPKGIKPQSIDHMLYSPGATSILRPPRVIRSYALSDHRPIVSKLRVVSIDPPLKPVKTRIDVKMMRREGEAIVHDNRWTALLVEEPIDVGELTSLNERFISTTDSVLRSYGVKVDCVDPRERMPRNVKQSLQRYKEWSKKLAKEATAGDVQDSTMGRYRVAKRKFKKLKRDYEMKSRDRHYNRITDDCLSYDYKNVWSRLRAGVETRSRGDSLPPVRDKDGNLVVEPDKILAEIAGHYQTITDYDPLKLSKDPKHWAAIDLGEPEPELSGINHPLKWMEIVEAIRGMNRNTSPGKDEIHINVLKSLVREESMANLAQDPRFKRPDLVMVDLPAKEFAEPLTPFGKALFKVLCAVWELELLPDQWNEVYLVNLFKHGNPEHLTNYRGISLISSALKVLLGVMCKRLSSSIDAAELLVPEQGGFRQREESIGQFLSLAEIVRRRHLVGKSTVGVFIDFQKAYDRVHHEALYRILEHMGVRGKSLNLIKYIYGNSKMTVRAGGRLAPSFRMWRGNRQGCPLSPLLFILFVNSLLKDSTAGGVEVPKSKHVLWDKVERKCPGLFYADDVVGLEETPAKAKEFAQGVWRWGQKWGMDMGIPKCGVICWAAGPIVRNQHRNIVYDTPAGVIPKVESYKYLGVDINSDLVDSRGNLEGRANVEMAFSRSQAAKGKKVLHQLRPLLTDRKCPLYLKTMLIRNFVMSKMLYGAEFIGWKKRNADPMQAVVNTAVKWAVGARGTTNLFEGFTLCYELGLPTIEEEINGRRARLIAKLGSGQKKLKTWIQILFDSGFTHMKRTWITLWGHPVHLETKYSPLLAGDEDISDQWHHFFKFWYEADKDGKKRLKPEYAHFTFAQMVAKFKSSALYLGIEDYPDPSKTNPLRPWAARDSVYAMHVRSNRFLSTSVMRANEIRAKLDVEGFLMAELSESHSWALEAGFVVTQFDYTAERDSQIFGIVGPKGRTPYESATIRTVREVTLEKAMTRNKSRTFAYYDTFCFGATRGFIRTSLSRPDLCDGVRWLVSIRSNAFPKVNARWNAIARTGGTPTFEKGCCPLCNEAIDSDYGWVHLLMWCTHTEVEAARVKFLSLPLECLSLADGVLESFVQLKDIMGLSIRNLDEGAKAIYLCGGVVDNRFYQHTYHLGYGQLDATPIGLPSYGYVYTASFLQEVAPLWNSAMGSRIYGVDFDLDPDLES
jgi:exonuclease III